MTLSFANIIAVAWFFARMSIKTLCFDRHNGIIIYSYFTMTLNSWNHLKAVDNNINKWDKEIHTAWKKVVLIFFSTIMIWIILIYFHQNKTQNVQLNWKLTFWLTTKSFESRITKRKSMKCSASLDLRIL